MKRNELYFVGVANNPGEIPGNAIIGKIIEDELLRYLQNISATPIRKYCVKEMPERSLCNEMKRCIIPRRCDSVSVVANT